MAAVVSFAIFAVLILTNGQERREIYSRIVEASYIDLEHSDVYCDGG